jgi:hypothetical protein
MVDHHKRKECSQLSHGNELWNCAFIVGGVCLCHCMTYVNDNHLNVRDFFLRDTLNFS